MMREYKYMAYTIVLGLGVLILTASVFTVLPTEDLSAATERGLYYTPEELAIWRQRAKSGPYKSKGDAGKNTPGDWDRIVSKKNSFMKNPRGDFYNGYTGGGCIPNGTSIEPRSEGKQIRDAAFYSLVKQIQMYAQKWFPR